MPNGWLGALSLSVLAGAVATGLGAVTVLALPGTTPPRRARLSGFAAGVMLSASMFSLAAPALELRKTVWSDAPWTLGIVALCFMAGAVLLETLNRVVPHEHFVTGPEGLDATHLRRLWLFVLAMTLHNFPEGMAVGVGAAMDGPERLSVAIGIGLQNLPEGLVVASALVDKGYARRTGVLVGVLSGAVEPIGAALGFGVSSLSHVVLPGALLFASGAMVYVVALEVLPEAHDTGHARSATWWVLIGFALNMVLDAAVT